MRFSERGRKPLLRRTSDWTRKARSKIETGHVAEIHVDFSEVRGDQGPDALSVLSNIAAKAYFLGEEAGFVSASRGVVRSRAKLLPIQFAVAASISLAALALMILGGHVWSTAVPAASAVFAAVLAACAAVRDSRPYRFQGQPDFEAPEPKRANDPLDLLKGLITRHDSAGMLVSIHGADRKAFGFGQPHADPSAFIDSVHLTGRILYLTAIDDLRQGEKHASADVLFAASSHEGGYRPVRIEMSAEYSVDGTFCGFLAQTRDVSSETTLRQDVASWKAQARTANDAKTRFLAAVSHELRTPLNAILGFSDILTGEYFGKFENDRQREYVELINQSGHHLLAVVNTMLDMSKIEAGRYDLVKEPFQIVDAVSTVDEMLSLQALSKGVVLTARVARGLDDVVADRRALQQVLINLAGNAIKFTDAGGVVAVDATTDGRNLVISVSDTGIGIPSDKLALIGKPFMQVQNDYTRRYDGTGLGLALVKGLVALHGGSFDIESEEGVGTVITVKVPMNGEGDGSAETFEFPPRLNERVLDVEAGEVRHGAAEAKIA
jgi:cell cycle sensor histidine kinase DivJ